MEVEAFILAGGRSSRLGRNKALERLGGVTLAGRAFSAVRDSAVASKITFVAGTSMKSAMEARRLDADFVFDLVEDRGPLGGLHTALASTTADWIFLLACDLPFVSADLIERLSAFMSEEVGAVVPEQPDGRLQPLCAFYKVQTARGVVQRIIYLPRVPPPMNEIVGMMNPRIVKPSKYSVSDASAEAFFTNINTQEDLRLATQHDGDQTEPDSEV